ncbi:MAG: uroporphyrinogen-III synthase [Geminicoccaceae bacterium]
MRVLVPRPADQAAATAAALAARGHEALVDPVLVIEPLPLAEAELAGAGAILLTSANAVPALPPAAAGLPLVCVGTATAAAAEAAGFVPVLTGRDDAAGLADLIRRELPPFEGALLHLCGEVVAPGTARAMRAAGQRYAPRVVYRSVPVPRLGDVTREALAAGRLDAVLLLSPRSAEVLGELVRDAGLAEACRAVIAVCLSEAIARAAAGLPWRAIRTAAERDQTALLDRLDPDRLDGSGGR